MPQVTDLNKIPADRAPNMSSEESLRRILWIINQLPACAIQTQLQSNVMQLAENSGINIMNSPHVIVDSMPPISGEVIANSGSNLNTSALALEAGNLAAISAYLAILSAKITPGVDGTSLGKAEDAVHTSGDVGIEGLTVRKDTPVALAGGDGDYQPLITDNQGRIYTNGSSVTQPVSGSIAVNSIPNITIAGGVMLTSSGLLGVCSNASSLGGGTSTQIIAAGTTTRIKIHRLHLVGTALVSSVCYWREGSGGARRFPTFLSGSNSTQDLRGSWILPVNTALYLLVGSGLGIAVEYDVCYEIV